MYADDDDDGAGDSLMSRLSALPNLCLMSVANSRGFDTIELQTQSEQASRHVSMSQSSETVT